MTNQRKRDSNAESAPTMLDGASRESLLRSYFGEGIPDAYLASAAGLVQVLVKITACYERFAKRCGLSSNSLFVLMALYYAQGPCTQKSIAELMWLPKQTVGSIVAGFKKKGLISEQASPTDGRAKALSLTEEGVRFCTGVFDDLRQAESGAIMAIDAEGLNAAKESFDAYAEAFAHGLDALDAREE